MKSANQTHVCLAINGGYGGTAVVDLAPSVLSFVVMRKVRALRLKKLLQPSTSSTTETKS